MHYRNKQAGATCSIILIALALLIFAAIGIPSFLGSCKMAPGARANMEMRTLQTGLEAYVVAWELGFPHKLHHITTPIACIQSIPKDPYNKQTFYSYYSDPHRGTADNPAVAIIWSRGPDKEYDLTRSLISERLKQERNRAENKITEHSITTLFSDLGWTPSSEEKYSGDIYQVFVQPPPTTNEE